MNKYKEYNFIHITQSRSVGIDFKYEIPSKEITEIQVLMFTQLAETSFLVNACI